MYQILIVDDEPLICKGLSVLLMEAGLTIERIFTANNGFEALDYLRMEDIDLLITDIQMGSMSGLDLMHQAKIVKPWVQTVVISAHEDFHYAQLAMRLGAKDYLIKPLNSEHLLDTVRNVLLKMNKTVPSTEEWMSDLNDHFAMSELHPQSTALLNELMNGKHDPSTVTLMVERLSHNFGVRLVGPYYGIVKIKLNTENEAARGRFPSDKDKELLRYAALNIVHESLGQERDSVAFHCPNNEIVAVLQWSEEEYADIRFNKIGQLELIGRSLDFNMGKYLHLECLVGISQILRGLEFLPDLHQQAEKAIRWNRDHQDNHVFYYGDFNWSFYAAEPSVEDINAQHNSIVKSASEYIKEHYHQKGLTLQEVAQKNHVSPNYLSYLFKKYTGFNLWEYVIKLRMEESKRLIIATDLRRYEISDRVGYESPEHFSKIFKKYYGMSPSDMKK